MAPIKYEKTVKDVIEEEGFACAPTQSQTDVPSAELRWVEEWPPAASMKRNKSMKLELPKASSKPHSMEASPNDKTNFLHTCRPTGQSQNLKLESEKNRSIQTMNLV